MSLQLKEEFADGSVRGDRIRNRHDGFEIKLSLLIGVQHRALIRSRARGVLDVVETFTVGFPDVDFYAFDGGAGGGADGAGYEAGGPLGIVGDEGAVRGDFCFVGVEGAEDCSFGCVGWFGVGD